jgi:uncharacterized protein involved in outer membrane biogenesis
VRIENSSLAFNDGANRETATLKIDRLSLRAPTPAAPVVLAFSGKANDVAFTIEAKTGAAATILAGKERLPVALTANALGVTVKADGVIAEPMAGKGLDLALSAKAANLDNLARALKLALPVGLPLDLAAQVQGGPPDIDINWLKLVFGATSLVGNASAKLGGQRPRLTATIDAERIDLNQLLPKPSAPTAAVPGRPAPSSARDKVFPSDPLPLDALKAADVRLDFKAKELITPAIRLSDVAAVLSLEGGSLALKPFRVGVAGSVVEGEVAFDSRPANPALALDVKGTKFDLGRLLTEMKVTDLLEGKADIAVGLKGQGKSVAALMGSLNGSTRVLMDQGRAKTQAFDMAVGGLAGVMGSLFGKSEWTVLNCVASDFAIQNGIATSRVLLVDTDVSTVAGEGTIDLGKELLAMTITPRSKVATLSLAVPVKVGGTLAAPSFRPDEVQAARRLAGVVGLALFPPAAIAGLADLGGGNKDHPCFKTAAAPAPSQPAATPQSNPLGAAGDGARRAVEGVGSGIQRLLGR